MNQKTKATAFFLDGNSIPPRSMAISHEDQKNHGRWC